MSSKGESKIPSPGAGGSCPVGGSTGQPKKKSLLPAPKSFSKPRALPTTKLSPTDKPTSPGREPATSPKSPADFVSDQYKVGDRIKISGIKTGVIKFLGKTHFAQGVWCGVELDEAEGKHDGLVEGIRYFQCTVAHGIFAPIHKIEAFTEDLYMYDSPAEAAYNSSEEDRSPSPQKNGTFIREKSTPPEKTSRLPQPKSHTRSKSLDTDIAKAKSPDQAKFQSKLTRPKAVSRSLSNKDGDSLTDSTSSSRESSMSRESDKPGAKPKPSMLAQPSRNIPRKAEKRPAKEVSRDSFSEGETSGNKSELHVQGKKTKRQRAQEVNDATFIHENTEDEDDLAPIQTESRVDTRTALTLAYNVESSGSDSEVGKQMNATFCKTSTEDDQINSTFNVLVESAHLNRTFNKEDMAKEDSSKEQLSKPSSGTGSSLHSPIPDLLTSAGFVRQSSLEWEEETDTMGMSTVSMTSSLGILTDTQLMDNSLLGEDFHDMLRKKELLYYHKDLDVLEADLDKEIAGISTPEIDMSSSTLSGKESSPEPEPRPVVKGTKKNLDLTFDNVQTSTPNTPKAALKSAGEKLATPDGSKEQNLRSKLYTKNGNDLNGTFVKNPDSPESMDVDSDPEGQKDDAHTAGESGGVYKRMDSTTDLDELKCHRLSASFELAKTAVEQYASLVKGAEQEKAQQDHRVNPKVLALRKSDAMTTSLEGRLDKLVSEDAEGLDDVSFPADLLASFSRSVESPVESNVSILFPKDSLLGGDQDEDEEIDLSEHSITELEGFDQGINTATVRMETNKPDIMLSALDRIQSKIGDKACNLSSDEFGQHLDDKQQKEPQALDLTFTALGPTEKDVAVLCNKSMDADVTMSTDSMDEPSVSSPTNLEYGKKDTTKHNITYETPAAAEVQAPDFHLSLKVDNVVDNDPDSLNVLTERCISQDSLDGLDTMQKDTTKKRDSKEEQPDLISKDVFNGNTTIVVSADQPEMSEEMPTQLKSAVVRIPVNLEDQLLADLEAGHVKNERPVSLVSSSSADTGILADYHRDDRKERPVSMVSTSSVDTGYQADTDTDLVPMTTSSPVGEGDTLTQCVPGLTPTDGVDTPSDVPQNNPGSGDSTFTNEGHTDSESVGMSEASSGPVDGIISSREHELPGIKPVSDWVDSDMDEQSQPEGESEPDETSGTESQQGEDTTVQEAITPEADTCIDDKNDLMPEDELPEDSVAELTEVPPGGQHDGSEAAPGKVGRGDGEESMETEGISGDHGNSDGDIEMVESATMKDVMEKCQTSPVEQLVTEISVEAHIQERDVNMEVGEVTRDDTPSGGEDLQVDMEVRPSCDKEKYESEEAEVGIEKLSETPELPATDQDQKEMIVEEETTNAPSDREESVTVTQTAAKSEKKVTSKVGKVNVKDTRSPRKRKDVDSESASNSKNPRTPKRTEVSKSEKSSPKVKSKSTGLQKQSSLQSGKGSSSSDVKRPTSAGVADIKRPTSASKVLKNVSNKKKVDISSSGSASPGSSHKGTPEKKSGKKLDPAAKEKEKQLVKARKQLDLLQSVPSTAVAPHHTTIEVRPVILSSDSGGPDSGSEDSPSQRPRPPRQSLARSKITSTTGTKSKGETTSKLAAPSSGTATQGKPKAGLGRGIPKPSGRPGGLPRPGGVSTKRTSTSASTTASEGTSSESKVLRRSVASKLGAGKSSLGSAVEGAVAGSSLSVGSDKSTKDGSRPSTASSRAMKPNLSGIKRTDRSLSIGSDTQLSDISQVSSQGQRSQSGGSTSASTTPRKGALAKRPSLAEPTTRRLPDPGRRATLAVTGTSRLVGPRAISKGPAPLATSTPAPKRANQNKNKPPRTTGTVSGPVSALKRPNQPDLVTNAISSANATQEITRLEALCEARTKELNKIKMQLRRSSTGFDAMAVLIKYLTEELNAFSCPQVTAQLADAQEHLQRAAHQLEELTNQRDALIAEIQCIKAQHTEETEQLLSGHQGALQSLEEQLTTEKQEELKKVIEKHSHEVTTLKSFHERNIRDLESERENMLQEKDDHYQKDMNHIKLEHDKQFSDLHQEHESKLNEITMRFETIKINLLEKVDFLRLEGEDLRRREASMVEKCQRDSEYKIQHALAQYKQEVDSLRAVMELRNSEIRELRRRNLEMEKQLEELPSAKEKVKSLQQKVENLQAIIDIRADNERSLSEKHHVLLRKYDKDSKAMKRLSMDNEELVWRLSMSDMGSPDSYRRSISHSPTNSESSTPEPTRRRKSPMPHSPRSPVEPKKSPLSKTPPVTNLKRSGTYDLLNQDFDEESNNIRQDS